MCNANMKSVLQSKVHFDLRLNGVPIVITATGDISGASKIGSSWVGSEECFWVGLLVWPGFGAAPVTSLGWFAAVEPLVSVEDESPDSDAPVSALVEPLWLTEPAFTMKKPPMSWDAVLMERNAQRILFTEA